MSNLNKTYFSLSVLVFVMLTALQLGLTEGPPRKLASDGLRQITFAYVNESVTLKCPVESSSDFQTFVDWTKGNMSLYMMQGYEITPKGYLKIKSVSNEHSGIYTCEAVNGYGTIRVNLTLVVDNPESASESYTMTNRNSAQRVQYYPPVITKRPAPFMVDVGGEATFHCIATGQPLPHIFWLKDGYLIEGSNTYISKRKTHSILKLKELKKSDAGDYKCIARSKAGEDEMDYTLQVTEPSPPPKVIALDPLKVTVREGSSITFVCEVASRAQVHIKWLKKLEDVGESVELSDVNLFRSGRMYYRSLNFTDSEFVTNGGIYKSKLLIRDSCEADSGTYVCLALNDKGFNFKNSTLKVIGKSNALATTPHFAANTTSLAVTIIVAAVVILGAVVFIAHMCCRNKSGKKRRSDRTSIPSIETGSMRQSTTSARKPNKCDLNPFPDIGEPRSTSRLLGIDSGYMFEHTESKSIQERTSFH